MPTDGPNGPSFGWRTFSATSATVSCSLKRTRKIGDDYESVEVMNSVTVNTDPALPAETLGIVGKATYAVTVKSYLDLVVHGAIGKDEFDKAAERFKHYQVVS